MRTLGVGVKTFTKQMDSNTLVNAQKASFWKRLIAFAIDSILIIIISALLGVIFKLSPPVVYWLDVALFYTYNIFMDTKHQATLGKIILKIKVIKADGTRPDLMNSFYRNFGKFISAIPLFYGFLRILAPHRRQTMHDELAKCLVIES